MESKNEETRTNGVEETAAGTVKETDTAAVMQEESAYLKATALFSAGAYYSAQEIFRTLGGYKQSREWAEKCGERIRELAQRHEDSLKEAQAKKKERDKAALKKKKRKAFIRKWLLPAAAVLAAVLAVTGGILLFLRQKREDAPYAAVEELLAQGSFEKAASEAKKLPEGEKKTKLMTGILREKAADQAARGLYEEAASTLESLYSAEDIGLVSEYRYKAAAALYEAGQYEEAETVFKALGDYNDSAAQVKNCEEAMNERDYAAAKALYEEGQYEEAEAAFAKLGDYSDSAAQAENCRKKKTERNYNAAKALYEAGQYKEAKAAFKALGDYKDSAEQVQNCEEAINERDYAAAKALYEAGQYEEAKAAFKALGKYGDSAAQMKKCEEALKERDYTAAKALYEAGKYEEACIIFLDLEGYKDVDTLLKRDKGLKKAAAALYVGWQPGSYVTFGAYEQDNDKKNGREPVEWLVLERNGNKVLLLSRYALDCKPYNTSTVKITWEGCTLRNWLNGEFMSDCFSEAERAHIHQAAVTADKNPSYGTDPGNDTQDKVFLLSAREAEKYFKAEADRRCVPTAYAKARGGWTSSSNTADGAGTCYWWLRSPGIFPYKAAYVSYSGRIEYNGDNVGYMNRSVRPALWVEIF